MNLILAQVQDYLRKAQEGPVDMPEEVIEAFGEACKTALRSRFTEPKREFTLRMSSIGRPLCQQKLDAAGVEGEPQGYHATFRNLIGDLLEAAGVAIMRAAKVRVNSIQKRVKLAIGGIELSGTYDVEIDGKIYDMKTASPYAFVNTFGQRGGFNKIVEDDHFGYVTQGYAYSEAERKPFGGWIAINKVTGEWNVIDVPDNDGAYRTNALARVDKNIRALTTKEAFKREYEDEKEVFYRKETGNKTLHITCSFCPYKLTCWPTAVHKPQAGSKAKVPKMIWYSEYKENDKNDNGADAGARASTAGDARTI